MDLGETMVLKGYAWAFAQYSDTYFEKQKLANLFLLGSGKSLPNQRGIITPSAVGP